MTKKYHAYLTRTSHLCAGAWTCTTSIMMIPHRAFIQLTLKSCQGKAQIRLLQREMLPHLVWNKQMQSWPKHFEENPILDIQLLNSLSWKHLIKHKTKCFRSLQGRTECRAPNVTQEYPNSTQEYPNSDTLLGYLKLRSAHLFHIQMRRTI